MGDGQWAKRTKEGYYVPFVSGLDLCGFLVSCQAAETEAGATDVLVRSSGHVQHDMSAYCISVKYINEVLYSSQDQSSSCFSSLILRNKT